MLKTLRELSAQTVEVGEIIGKVEDNNRAIKVLKHTISNILDQLTHCDEGDDTSLTEYILTNKNSFSNEEWTEEFFEQIRLIDELYSQIDGYEDDNIELNICLASEYEKLYNMIIDNIKLEMAKESKQS